MASHAPLVTPCYRCHTPAIEVTWDEQYDMPPYGTVRLEPHALDPPHILAAILAGRTLWQLYDTGSGARTRKRTRWWPTQKRPPKGRTLVEHDCNFTYTGLPEINLDTVHPPTPETPPF